MMVINKLQLRSMGSPAISLLTKLYQPFPCLTECCALQKVDSIVLKYNIDSATRRSIWICDAPVCISFVPSAPPPRCQISTFGSVSVFQEGIRTTRRTLSGLAIKTVAYLGVCTHDIERPWQRPNLSWQVQDRENKQERQTCRLVLSIRGLRES